MSSNTKIYEIACIRCNNKFEGYESDCNTWMEEKCPAENFKNCHIGVAFPKYRNNYNFKCRSCGRVYVQIVGDLSTETLCSTCVESGLQEKPYKSLSNPLLSCGVNPSYINNVGFSYSHSRKDFFLRGEDWACAGFSESYDTLSGSETYTCGKRAHNHLKLPKGMVFKNGTENSHCAVLCDKCAARYMQIAGVTNIGLL